MASKVDLADDFGISGPIHMISSPMRINWDSEEHRRCIAACLVNGTYVVEKDRTRCRVYTKALAPAWWENFHFRLKELLTDNTLEHDKFIFGAIYENVGCDSHPSAPRYVIAFRGTMLIHPKYNKDLYLDIKVMINTLSKSRRSRLARQAVDTITRCAGAGHDDRARVWLTGHSLGASLALDIGRTIMTDQGLNLPTFLFNPPHVSLSPVFNLLRPAEVAKRDLCTINSHVKAGLGLLLSPHRKRMAKLFEKLSPWAPELFVHERDAIGQGFIDYFQQRHRVEELFHGVAKSAMMLSYRDMVFSLLSRETERPHLLPSATLWKNSSIEGSVHVLHQWWKPDVVLKLSVRRYSYPGC